MKTTLLTCIALSLISTSELTASLETPKRTEESAGYQWSDEDDALLNRYAEKVVKLAEPDTNDERYHEYVKYINTFLRFFGHEDAIVAGSTAEKTKLRTNKYGGDADFLLISGAFNISVSQLEFRWDNSRYVWIHGETLLSSLGGLPLVDGKYMPSSLLKEMQPECFNILRGFVKLFTSTSDSEPGHSRVVTTGEKMKVGFLRYQYRDFKVDSNVLPPKSKVYKYIGKKPSSTHQQRKGVLNEEDGMDTLLHFLSTLSELSPPDSNGDHEGQLLHFAHILKLLFGEYEIQTDDKTCSSSEYGGECSSKLNEEPVDVTVSCSSFTSKDFVPAFRVSGTFNFMKDWLNRKRNWPPKKFVKAIYQSDIYIVAKLSPIDGYTEKDFCLSFNRPEILLSKAYNGVQRKCILILKAFHHGVLKDLAIKYKQLEAVKLTSYHLKTAMFHVGERADPSLWREGTLREALLTLVRFLIDALDKGVLEHFFVGGNLFLGMDTVYRADMKAAFENIERDVLGSIDEFFTREDTFGTKPIQIQLSEEAAVGLLQIAEDGGMAQTMGNINEAMGDFRRGFLLAPKNKFGRPPIDDAIFRTAEVAIEHEFSLKLKRNRV